MLCHGGKERWRGVSYTKYIRQCIIDFWESAHLFFLRVPKEGANLLLAPAHVLVQDLRAVDDLGLPAEHKKRGVKHLWVLKKPEKMPKKTEFLAAPCVQDLPDFPRNEGFAAAGRAEQQDAAHVVDAELLDEAGENAGRKRAPKHRFELVSEPSDAHFFEFEVALEQRVVGG